MLLGSFATAGTGKKVPTFEEILSFQNPGYTYISPDGKWILYTLRDCDMKENTYRSQIWMVDTANGQPRQMTFVKKSSYSPQWAPDSRSFTFLSAREGKTRIYIMSAFGGEPRPLTDSKTGIFDYAWSKDGKTIAYTTSDEKSKKQKGIEKKYGKFEAFNEKFNINHLWLLDVETEKAEKVIDDENLHVEGFSWSPDGTRIAFSASPDTLRESFAKSDIYVYDIKNKKVRHLVKTYGPDYGPVWSEDGKHIAYTSNMGKAEYYVNSHICTIPADGGEIVDMTADFDENADILAWKGKYIWFSALQGMSSHIFRIDTKTKKISQFSRETVTIGGASMSDCGTAIAFVSRDAAHCPEIFVTKTKSYKPLRLTDFGRQVKDWTLATKEPIKWKSTDGAEITGILTKPADFDPNKKYPLLVVIHGGPASISIPSLYDRYGGYYPIEQWVARGAVVLQPNYRGSTGFGEAFRKLNLRNLGVGDYWDVISGVDYLISKGFIDENRLASMGWSQGGYISAFIATYSKRFKAVSVGAGISDWITYYSNTDIPPFTRHYLGATPWDDEAVYKKTSPMTYINNAQTPTLIQHGEFDQRVPIPNAYKLYRGLKDKNVPVRFIIYKGFGHGISRPKEKLAVIKHNYDWFNKYIWGEEPKEEKLEDQSEDNKEDD